MQFAAEKAASAQMTCALFMHGMALTQCDVRKMVIHFKELIHALLLHMPRHVKKDSPVAVRSLLHNHNSIMLALRTNHMTCACAHLTGSAQITHCLDFGLLQPSRRPAASIFQVLGIYLHMSQHHRSLQHAPNMVLPELITKQGS